MKLALLCESEHDETVISALIRAIRAEEITFVPDPDDENAGHLRTRGFTTVPKILPAFLKYVTVNHQDVSGVVLVVDSDHSLVHTETHETTADQNCRLCQLRGLVEDTINSHHASSSVLRLSAVIGLASPALENWLLKPEQRPRVAANEATWARELARMSPPKAPKARGIKSELKKLVYGSARPRKHRRQKVTENVVRFDQTEIDHLTRDFPGGFGAFAQAVQAL